MKAASQQRQLWDECHNDTVAANAVKAGFRFAVAAIAYEKYSGCRTLVRSAHIMKCYVTILFGLFVIWTGLWRCIEAQAFKPNAFWFCLTMGLLAIGAGYGYRLGQAKIATIVALSAGIVVLAFYVYCLIKQPEKDATSRVGLVIVAAIAQIVFILLPEKRPDG